ncbi:MAG: hypothetical protein Q8P41_10835 [Pseudomonadota bacterium]|nr:hypothetical protein [Pseudomonadota bacterium]
MLILSSACERESLTPAPTEAPSAPLAPVLTEVRLPLLDVATPFRWDDEFRGLATMAMELGLSDIPGTVVRVPGDAAPPSVLMALPVSRRQVDARFLARGTDKALELELELCVAGEGCESTIATGTREAPWEAIGALLDGAAQALGARVPEEVAAAWHTPGSKDPYAELITGRAAATYYGILPPPDDPTDRRTNSVIRAVLIDPKQPLALWTLARWDVGATSDAGKAADTLARAALVRPHSRILDADRATVLTATGKPDQAVLVWEQLRAGALDDPRFLEPTARALLVAGRPADARAVLDAFPAEFRWEPRVAELRVAVAEAVDGTAGLDPLLAHWQETDPRAVAPVRRRLDLRVQTRRFGEALAMVPALRTRAPGPQTDALEVALLVAVGRVREAADRAPVDTAARLRARAERAIDPGAPLDGLPDGDLEGKLARADGLVYRGDAGQAIVELDELLEERPWRADAHAARARALERLGRTEDSSAEWQLAWEIDPAMEGGPVAVTRIASTFQYVVNAPPPVDARVPEAPVGRKGPEL